MKENPKRETYYGQEVWVNPMTEPLRKNECLCLNCGNLKPGKEDNCRIAQAFYEICVKENIALIVTRCPIWVNKEAWDRLSDAEKAKITKMEESIP